MVGIGELNDNNNHNDSSDDTNTWDNDDATTFGGDSPLTVQYFDNYNLLKQLSTAGTKFRWSNDPTQTVYTITDSYGGRVYNYKRGTIVTNNSPDHERANMGYRLYLQLDRNIVWSPTSTIASGFANN